MTLYDAIGGDATVLRLAAAWHARVLDDEVVGHAFSHGFRDDHTERLAAYWTEAFGGPAAYTERYGREAEVVRMHSGNGLHEDMDRRAIACFDRALVDAGITDGALTAALHGYFAGATTRLAGYPSGGGGHRRRPAAAACRLERPGKLGLINQGIPGECPSK